MASTRPKTPKRPSSSPPPETAAEPDEHAIPPPVTDEQAEEQEEQAVAVLTQGDRALAQATTVEDVQDVRERAEAARRMLRMRKRHIREVNAATYVKLKAERKLGLMLMEMDKHPGAATRLHDETTARLHDETAPPKLADLGISKLESHRSQRLASIPEGLFHAHC